MRFGQFGQWIESYAQMLWFQVQMYAGDRPAQVARIVTPVWDRARKSVQPMLLPTALCAAALVPMVVPAHELQAEPPVVEVLPPDVRGDVLRLNAAVSELEARTHDVAMRIKPKPDAMDQVIGGEPASWTKLRGKDSAKNKAHPADVSATLDAANRRIADLSEQVAMLSNTIDTRREMTAAMPLARPVNGVVTSQYGWRKSPFGGLPELHAGVDIGAPKGSVIMAPADGVVVSAGKHQGYGELLVIDHGYGVQTAFGHLARVDVKEGAKVKRGQAIALIGISGQSTGPHLHYEVRVDGEPVDPTPFLTFDLARAQALTAPGA